MKLLLAEAERGLPKQRNKGLGEMNPALPYHGLQLVLVFWQAQLVCSQTQCEMDPLPRSSPTQTSPANDCSRITPCGRGVSPMVVWKVWGAGATATVGVTTTGAGGVTVTTFSRSVVVVVEQPDNASPAASRTPALAFAKLIVLMIVSPG
ncbi:MAG: hypothetical protein A2045_00855 [Rhodocyclales bacterium GWA2_65_20]|nr:MAG: hypothetical protein A2045_00855 [Rhodocyclales bacterium GWA2_65_20]